MAYTDYSALTPAQEVFVQEYLVDLNASGAARRAKLAAGTGRQLLGLAHVQQAINEAMQERMARLRISQDRLLQELAAIAFSDIGEFVEFGRKGIAFKDQEEYPRWMRRAIKKVSETVTQYGGSQGIELHDKIAAIQLLMRHAGMLNDKLAISDPDGGKVCVQIVRYSDRAAITPPVEETDDDDMFA